MGEHMCESLGSVDEIELNCTEMCYKSGKSLLFSRKVLRRGFSGWLCLWTISHSFPLPALPSSAFLHLCSSRDRELPLPIEQTVTSVQYLVHTNFLNDSEERRKPYLVHDLWRTMDTQQLLLHQVDVKAAQKHWELSELGRTEPSCPWYKLLLTKLMEG